MASLKVFATTLKRDETGRDLVRKALKPQVESLGVAVNKMLDKARLGLRKHSYPTGEPHYEDIVLVIDSLDRIRRFGDEKENERTGYDLFIRNASTLTDLRAHIVCTLPLSLIYAFPGDLQSRYEKAPITVPMVAVESRHGEPGTPYASGVRCLKEMLALRMHGWQPEDIFSPEALDWILMSSGGHVRSLMIFAQTAITLTDTLPIPLHVTQRATSPTRENYSRFIPDKYWPMLADLYNSESRLIDTRNEAYREMLEQVIILEYRNGDENPESESEPWYAVNPIVRRLNGFKAALTEYDAKAIEHARKAAIERGREKAADQD